VPQKIAKTTCALLTPKGRGAVAVIAVSGTGAQTSIEAEFQTASGKPYSQTAPRKIVYGLWRSSGEDLVVYRRNATEFEIHCHGGNTASTSILKTLSSRQIERISAHEFETNLHGLWKSETLEALSKATTERTATLLLHQYELLPQCIEAVIADIESGEIQTAISKLADINRWANFGIHLTQPRSIVLCGRPNVGKSSLANAIVGFQRTIVHDVAGTTRDVISQLTAIDGWPVELSDTAGLRDSQNKIEAIGIQKAKSQIESADVKICVFDLSLPWGTDDQATLELVEPDLIVHNKCDLPSILSSDSKDNETASISRPAGISTSAASGTGIDHLIKQIGERLFEALPPADQAIPVSLAQADRLRTAEKLLRLVDSRDQEMGMAGALQQLRPFPRSNE